MNINRNKTLNQISNELKRNTNKYNAECVSLLTIIIFTPKQRIQDYLTTQPAVRRTKSRMTTKIKPPCTSDHFGTKVGIVRRFLPLPTSTISQGRKGDQSRSKECFLSFMLLKKSQTTTRVMKLPLEMITTPPEILSIMCAWASECFRTRVCSHVRQRSGGK